MAKKMAKRLGIERDDERKYPWFEHPVLSDGEDRFSCDEAVKRLAEIGGDTIKEAV
jgi:hypothetical protein